MSPGSSFTLRIYNYLIKNLKDNLKQFCFLAYARAIIFFVVVVVVENKRLFKSIMSMSNLANHDAAL